MPCAALLRVLQGMLLRAHPRELVRVVLRKLLRVLLRVTISSPFNSISSAISDNRQIEEQQVDFFMRKSWQYRSDQTQNSGVLTGAGCNVFSCNKMASRLHFGL